jgi:hypothetical protein
LWDRWISEIVADFWSVARIGISSTTGLIGVVSLPRAFVFRMDLEDPHPTPWIRVKLSAAIGNALFPHPQWQRLAGLWNAFYPLDGISENKRALLTVLEETMPEFVSLLLEHRPKSLLGKSLREVMVPEERQPARLAALFEAWGREPDAMRRAPPTLACAVIGQARADGRITPEQEAQTLSGLLNYWALRSALESSWGKYAERGHSRTGPRPQLNRGLSAHAGR